VARKKPGGNPSIGIGFHFETTKGTSSRVERKEKNFVKKNSTMWKPIPCEELFRGGWGSLGHFNTSMAICIKNINYFKNLLKKY
jgi:hypothetical protein